MTTATDDALWAAIAEPSRRRVLDLLVRGGEATASALAAEVPFTRQAVIKHLAVLEQAKLVTRRKEGREVLFRVDPGRLDEASRALTRVARAWDRRLGDIKEIAEAEYQRSRTDKNVDLPATRANPESS
jgi:DNA-binding transcriptional ArsR family regulator